MFILPLSLKEVDWIIIRTIDKCQGFIRRGATLSDFILRSDVIERNIPDYDQVIKVLANLSMNKLVSFKNDRITLNKRIRKFIEQNSKGETIQLNSGKDEDAYAEHELMVRKKLPRWKWDLAVENYFQSSAKPPN